jgi:hypothetical protein
MPAAVKLGQTPKHFAPFPVRFTMPDGQDAVIRVTYNYRTRKQYAQMVDTLAEKTAAAVAASASAAPASVDPVAPTEPTALAATPAPQSADGAVSAPVSTFAAYTATRADQQLAFILEAVHAWDLDAPFGANTAQQLCDEIPAAGAAIVAGYRDACVEGHLGN